MKMSPGMALNKLKKIQESLVHLVLVWTICKKANKQVFQKNMMITFHPVEDRALYATFIWDIFDHIGCT